MKKKTVSLCLAFLLVLGINVGAFKDINPDTDEGMAILKMKNCGYINGFEDGTFKKDNTLTRAEFVKIVNKIYGYTEYDENIFNDIKESDWFYKDVLIGTKAGYIKGHDGGRFAPEDKVSREQVCVMMNRVLNAVPLPFSQKISDPISDWARESVEILISNRFFALEEGNKFRATVPITRGEACVALEKCIIDIPVEIEYISLEDMAKEEIEKKLKTIIEVLEKDIIPQYTYEVNHEIAGRIISSMKKYIKNPQYDYIPDAKATYEIYRKGDLEAREFKDLIYKNMDIDSIAILFDFFYRPEIRDLS